MKNTLLCSLLSLYALALAAQPTENPVQWTFVADVASEGEAELTFKAAISPGWYLYAQFIGDEGPIPTSIVFEDAEGMELLGPAVEEGHKVEGMDDLFGIYITKFKDEAVFRQRIKRSKELKAISGYIEFMVCDDEKCLPPSKLEFNFFFE
ncbi:MAG: hypothetical protein KDC66_11780 [Phaeodactylibacter sp.]|nr:hypothetical protein [Phaeodactylibacter sp.]MCB9273812.1 hypothetical protein [Lewinellaceae bacterium]